MAVSNTDVNLNASIASECKVVQSTDISLSAMMSNSTVGGITHTYAGQLSGTPSAFEKIGGSNNPLASSPNTTVTASHRSAMLSTPHHMSHAIGGYHEAGGGPGQ
jgi:hypothetical protein|tara:strand:- start:363 stop:677 length:315 start_codon:yes stop_codon:yes gene_type:complete